MTIISKYRLPFIDGDFPVEMRTGAKVLSVSKIDSDLYAWVLEDAKKPMKNKYFRVLGHMHEIENSSSYRFIGTVDMDRRLPYVLQVFEKRGNR